MLPLDPERCARHLSAFVELADAGHGLQGWFDALESKHRKFAALLGAPVRIGMDETRALLETVFPARRKLYPLIERMGAAPFAARVDALLHGGAPVEARMAAFRDALPYPEGELREARRLRRKLRGAAHDFAAEVLHFAQPARHPLMTRWVWDGEASSGALRELMDVPEGVAKVDVEMTPGAFESARRWLTGQFEAQGLWRDHHWWCDLVLAMAFIGYFRAMTGGVLGSDFTRSSTPEAQLIKLLGLEPARRDGRSRVRASVPLH